MIEKLQDKRSGITLIELIVVLAIMGLIGTGAFSMLSFGNKSFKTSSQQYDVQSDVRLAVDLIQREVRFATTLEIIDLPICTPGSEPSDYDYIYISNGSLINSIYEGPSSRKLSKIGNTISSDSRFSVEGDWNDVLGIYIKGSFNGQQHEVKTSVNLSNFQLGTTRSQIVASASTVAIKYKRPSTLYATASPTPTISPTFTPSPTSTATATTTPTGTPVPTITATPTPTASPTVPRDVTFILPDSLKDLNPSVSFRGSTEMPPGNSRRVDFNNVLPGSYPYTVYKVVGGVSKEHATGTVIITYSNVDVYVAQ